MQMHVRRNTCDGIFIQSIETLEQMSRKK